MLKFDLYIFAEMIEEYELILNFVSPKEIYFTTTDKFYWISSYECRSSSLLIYNKMDVNIFRFIASFCSQINFYGISHTIDISQNGMTVKTREQKQLHFSEDYENAVLFGDF